MVSIYPDLSPFSVLPLLGHNNKKKVNTAGQQSYLTDIQPKCMSYTQDCICVFGGEEMPGHGSKSCKQ